MQIELDGHELEALMEALDCLKTKIAFTKGLAPAVKNERLEQAAALELKLSGYIDPPS